MIDESPASGEYVNTTAVDDGLIDHPDDTVAGEPEVVMAQYNATLGLEYDVHVLGAGTTKPAQGHDREVEFAVPEGARVVLLEWQTDYEDGLRAELTSLAAGEDYHWLEHVEEFDDYLQVTFNVTDKTDIRMRIGPKDLGPGLGAFETGVALDAWADVAATFYLDDGQADTGRLCLLCPGEG